MKYAMEKNRKKVQMAYMIVWIDEYGCIDVEYAIYTSKREAISDARRIKTGRENYVAVIRLSDIIREL